MTFIPTGNVQGDIYTNDWGARVEGSPFQAVSNQVSSPVIASSIGDIVWYDANRNGLKETDEPIIPNVSIHLTGMDAFGKLYDTTMNTSSTGYYLFDGLRQGTYTVTATPLSQFPIQTYDYTSGTLDNIATVTLGKSDKNPLLDFGYISPISMGDTVWEDTNGNGVQDA
jgi:hypothetical protein